MSNELSIASQKSKYIIGAYPALAVDGVPLEIWLPRQNHSIELDLAPAHSCLNDNEDICLVWDRTYSTAPGWKTLVPLLVCPDDQDLNCIVIVAEQYADKSQIHWHRFGSLTSSITADPPSVDWYEAIPSLTFERHHYQSVLDEFRKQENIRMDWD